MNKIWFFGDSYVSIAKQQFLEKNFGTKSWTKIVTETFPEYNNWNIALAGSSLDFLYYTYEQRRKEFKSGDIVIMSLTTIERLLLRNDKKNTHSFLRPKGIVTHEDGICVSIVDDHPWCAHFADDLFNPETHKATLNLFLNSLQYDAMTKGIKIIALPITHFPFLDTEDKDHITLGRTVKGHSLLEVTNRQLRFKFDGKYKIGDFWNQTECREYDNTLHNHLTPRNNEILANKLIRNIKTNEPIDLTTEWEF